MYLVVDRVRDAASPAITVSPPLLYGRKVDRPTRHCTRRPYVKEKHLMRIDSPALRALSIHPGEENALARIGLIALTPLDERRSREPLVQADGARSNRSLERSSA
jgi:hypothetical protein